MFSQIYLFVVWFVCLFVSKITHTNNWYPWNLVEGCSIYKGRTYNFGVDLEQVKDLGFIYFGIFSTSRDQSISQRIYHGFQFRADTNKNLHLVNLNVVSWGECYRSCVDVWTLLNVNASLNLKLEHWLLLRADPWMKTQCHGFLNINCKCQTVWQFV